MDLSNYVDRAKLASELFELKEELDTLRVLIEEGRESASHETQDLAQQVRQDLGTRIDNQI